TQVSSTEVNQRTRLLPTLQKDSRTAVGKNARTGPEQRVGDLLLTTLWFGLLAGWLEMGLVLAQKVVNPHVSVSTLRTNRHLVWMIPVSDLLIFSVVGLSIALLARFRWGLAR